MIVKEVPGTDTGALARLWAPHRMSYVNRDSASRLAAPCALCGVPEQTDDAGFVIHRGRHSYVVLNRYPYNNGHVMVVPYRHESDYTALTIEELAELTSLTRRVIDVLQIAVRAQGFNVGLNLGEAAGAGIAHHLHQHVVPRWLGDTNFMPVLGGTTVMPQLLDETWLLLRRTWQGSHAPTPVFSTTN